jgi:glycosyltransferase involved in cell wall biosynthesis
LEKWGEEPQLKSADVVACVSEEVAEKVLELGVEERRIIVTPCSVDVDRFAPTNQRGAVRAKLNLNGRFVIGWVGSFRKFHGVDLLLDAYAQIKKEIPNAALLLVGDGFERSAIVNRAQSLHLQDVVFTGTVPHAEMPDYIGAMDIAVVVDPGRGEFHYSPLKLKEYMACGVPVIAPNSGQLGQILNHEQNALTIPAGDPSAMIIAIQRLYADSLLRVLIAQNARRLMLAEGDWSYQLERVMSLIEKLPMNPRLDRCQR